MDNVESSMEQAIQDAGFSISDTPPTQDAQPTQEAQPVQQAPVEPQQTTAPEPSAPVEQQPVQQQEVQQEAAPVQQDVQDYVQPNVQPEQSSLQDETQSGLENFFQALSEAVDEPAQETIQPDTTTAQDVDPRIQVIADFVAKTGRSPEDWFRYQSLDPSEMDDRTAMRVHMASEYPSLGNDEIDLLINSKYRTDDSIYNDEEVRLANLQLKIDAEKARQSIGDLRNDYTSPILQSFNPSRGGTKSFRRYLDAIELTFTWRVKRNCLRLT